MTVHKPRTLVVHGGGIGDFILACPALAALRGAGPVELAGNPDRLRLAQVAGIASGIHDLDSIGFHTIYSEPAPRLIAFLQRFARVHVFLRDDGEGESKLRARGITHLSFHAGIPPATWSGHASAYYARCLGVTPMPDFKMDFAPIPGWDIVIHPGSGGRHKNWPYPHFCELGASLLRDGRRVAWLSGPAERDLPAPAGVEAVQCEDLAALAGRLAGSRGYVGNDGGITHLAAASACPAAAIFGPTDPAVWAPRGAAVAVCRGEPWPDAGAVHRALNQLMAGS